VNIQYSKPYHTNGASNPSRYADKKEDFIVYRIIALKDFGDVKAGDKGGYVADEHSLSQDGTCWVYDNGYIGYKAQVKDDALIKSGAKVLDFAIIKDNAVIDKHGIVLNSAIIKDKAHIKNGLVTANAVIGGNTIVDGYGMVGEDMIVLGNSIINSYARVGKDIENVILEDNQRKVTDYDAGKEKEYAARRVQNEIASWGINLKNDAGYASRLRKELILCKGAFGKFFSYEKGWYI
jgi:carbonic anhydrase/acetyltransferase-like protein (isoleucine patch superfamily)